MAEYEYNADLWFYKGHEYRRGDSVTIDEGELDDDHKAFIAQLVVEGTLVDPGFAEKLAKEQEKAEQAAEDRRLAQVEADDAEAARKVDVEQRLLHGDPAPKPGPRRASAK